MAARNNDDAAIADYHGAARRGDGDGFLRLRDRRFNAALYLVCWGAAGILSTTVPSLAANGDHLMVYFLLLIAGALLLLLSVAAPDLPWLERAAGRLEGLLGSMF